jgi:predicted site-specific integrase-resolvase
MGAVIEVARLQGTEVDKVFVKYKGRLSRFGYRYLKRYFKGQGVDVSVVEDRETDYHKKLMNDLISIASSFSARILFMAREGQDQKTRKGGEVECLR